jgi:hypothetical protein
MRHSPDRGQAIVGFERTTGLGAFGFWSGVASTGGFVLWLVSNDGGLGDWSKLTSRASGVQIWELMVSSRLCYTSTCTGTNSVTHLEF